MHGQGLAAACAAACALWAAAAAGCRATGPGGGDPLLLQGEAEARAFFERGAALEADRSWDEALAFYGRVRPGSPESPSEAWIRARFRMGRCCEEMGRPIEARSRFAEVLACPNLSASDGDIPLPGSVDINFRKRAERAMERIGFPPERFYLARVRDPSSPLLLVAVKSLERTGGREALAPLEDLLASAEGAVHAAAVRTLGRIRSRIERSGG